MATVRIGDYQLSIKALDVSEGKKEATGSFINTLGLFCMYASRWMKDNGMRTCALEADLWSADAFHYLCSSKFYEQVDKEFEEIKEDIRL